MPTILIQRPQGYWKRIFQPTMSVRYVPIHAQGDLLHPDCENGIVSSVVRNHVFVYFRGSTPQRCDAESLVKNSRGFVEFKESS